MMRRTIHRAVVFFALCAGCSRPPVSADWIVARLDSEPETLNPVLYKTAAAQSVMFGGNNSQVYEFLLQYNRKTWALTEPLLAESHPEISADRLTYTYKLRDGVRWHDGRPLTPEDIVFTFKATMCPLVDSAEKRSSLADMTNVEILEDRRIRFTFAKPNVFNIHSTGNQQGIIPKHVFDPDGVLDSFSYKDVIGPKGKTDPKIKEFADRFNKHLNNRMPIGTGPYRFEKWETGMEIHLARMGTTSVRSRISTGSSSESFQIPRPR
jgi:peptide/nickel transport system substrate-binding protein